MFWENLALRRNVLGEFGSQERYPRRNVLGEICALYAGGSKWSAMYAMSAGRHALHAALHAVLYVAMYATLYSGGELRLLE